MEESGKNLCDKNIKSTVKFAEEVLWCGGVFHKRGLQKLVLIDGIMDEYKYVDIFNDGLMASVDMIGHKTLFFKKTTIQNTPQCIQKNFSR